MLFFYMDNASAQAKTRGGIHRRHLKK